MRDQMEKLIDSMLDGKILLGEAAAEFEKLFILKALERNGDRLAQTADVLGIHRNTLAKRVTSYNGSAKKKAASKRSVRKPTGRRTPKKK